MPKNWRRYRRHPDCVPLICSDNDPKNRGPGSTSISGRDALELIDAAKFASLQGWHLNVAMIFNPGEAGLKTVEHAGSGFIIFRKRLQNWLLVHNIAAAYLDVWEQSSQKGLHCHLMVHVPAEFKVAFALELLATAWVGEAVPTPPRR